MLKRIKPPSASIQSFLLFFKLCNKQLKHLIPGVWFVSAYFRFSGCCCCSCNKPFSMEWKICTRIIEWSLFLPLVTVVSVQFCAFFLLFDFLYPKLVFLMWSILVLLLSSSQLSSIVCYTFFIQTRTHSTLTKDDKQFFLILFLILFIFHCNWEMCLKLYLY